jgi:hypothetical protein
MVGKSIEYKRMRRVTSEILGAAIDEEPEAAAANEEPTATIEGC